MKIKLFDRHIFVSSFVPKKELTEEEVYEAFALQARLEYVNKRLLEIDKEIEKTKEEFERS